MTMTTATDEDQFRRIRPQKLRPIKALQAFRKLVRDKEDTRQVFEIMRALSGRSIARGYNRLLTTVEGGRQAFLAQELAERLDDSAWLAQFQPGSVGAAYRDFRHRMGFTADGLAEIEREAIPFVDAPHPIVWYSRRLRDVHDIWHVLTGYGTDALGEACLVAFSYGQTRNLGFAFIGAGAAREIRRENRSIPAGRAVFEAWRHGRAARWLPALDYERLFALPLDQARRDLNIRPPRTYDAIPAADRSALRLRGH